MKKNFYLLLAVFFGIFSSGFAQSNFHEGYLINNGNDTVFAQVSYRSDIKNYRSCIFKKQDIVSTYLPDEISGYGYTGDKFFKAGIIDSELEVRT